MAEYLEENCEDDCSSVSCRDAFQVVLAFHDKCSPSEVPHAVGHALHDVEDVCAAQSCNTGDEGADPNTCDDHDHDHDPDHDHDHDHDHGHDHDHDHGHDHSHDDHGHGHDDHGHDDHGHGHDHDHDHDGHSDVYTEWTFHCDNIDALTDIQVGLFEAFPNLTELDVQYLTEDKQGAAELTPRNARLRF
ncbi:MAG: DUF2796 domain-containing protein [Saccharospirillum sp.]|nr:DUF2796 domain-containing protein [Saccharospirillum sp.]